MQQDSDYNEFFRGVVLMGLTCGLGHPVEWAIQADRTPGGTLSPEYYAACDRHLPRFLVETFEAEGPSDTPTTAEAVLAWCDRHFPEGHMMVGYFAHKQDALAQLLASR